jgi:hypothetical protein
MVSHHGQQAAGAPIKDEGLICFGAGCVEKGNRSACFGDKRGPVTPTGGATRARATFGAGAQRVSVERARRCDKAHAVGAASRSENHAFGRRFKPASINRPIASDRVKSNAALSRKRPGRVCNHPTRPNHNSADQRDRSRGIGTFGSEGLGERVVRYRGTGANQILHATGRVLRQANRQSYDRCRLCRGDTPIVREQLQKAGVRLAHMLDAALGK